jgi:hypothetical protein
MVEVLREAREPSRVRYTFAVNRSQVQCSATHTDTQALFQEAAGVSYGGAISFMTGGVLSIAKE